MKKITGFLIRIFKYKIAPINFKVVGYHCSECEGDCERFDCPCKPDEKLIKRFK